MVHALRRPPGLRLRRSVRQARARRRAHRRRSRRSGPANAPPALRRDLNAGGSKFCGDCPLKLPLTKDEAPPAARRSTSARCPSRLYIECTAACNISCAQACCAPETGITRTRQAGMLDFELFRASSTRPGRRSAASTSSTTARPSCTSAPSRCASTSRRAFRTSISTRAPTASRSPRSRSGGSCTPASTRSRSRSTAPRRRATRSTGSAATSPRRSATCGRGRREAARRARRAVHQLALHPVHAQRQRRGDGRWRARMAAEIGVDRLCWELTDHPEDMFSRRFVPGTPRARTRSGTRSGTTTTSATPSPAPRRARAIDVRGPLPRPAARSPGPGAPLTVTHARPQPVDPARSRPRPATAAGSCGSARSSAPATASLINRDYERAWLPATLQPGVERDVPIDASRRRQSRDATR